MFSLKNADAQSTNAQSLRFENFNKTAIDALLSQIFLSSEFRIIKFEKIKSYKSQSENKHQRWFRNAKLKMMSASKYFVINKIKIFWCMQFLESYSVIQWFIYSFDDETMTIDQIIYLKFKQFLLNFVIDSINRRLIVYKKFDAIHQKIDQKVSVFKICLKEIKKKLSFFDEYHKIILFLTKLTSVLKNKLFSWKMCLTLKRPFYLKLLCKKLHWVARAKATTTLIIKIKTINFSIINLIEINNLTKLVISINSKRMINQIIISTRRRSTSARMRKWRMKRTIIVLNVINRSTIIEIAQKKINEARQLWSK